MDQTTPAHIIEGFTPLETHHCETGSLLHLYRHGGSVLSENMLFGLGEGIGFIYWHQKGAPPFLGGRSKANVAELAGERTGVKVRAQSTTSAKKARDGLLAALDAGAPVMLQVDMGFLPYFDFGGSEYHFGGHVVAAWGYDPDTDTVYLADRDADLHPVSMADLAKARGSTYKPFPPRNTWWELDFADYREPTAEELLESLKNSCRTMLTPPISNIGVKGIAKAADQVAKWPKSMSTEDLKWACFNGYIFISPVGGTGGGIFRYMFSRYLAECAERTATPELADAARRFRDIADGWQEIAAWFKAVSEVADPASRMHEVKPMLLDRAREEERAWADLAAVVECRVD